MCRGQLRGVEQPIELFSVSSAAIQPVNADTWNNYDAALSLFEHGQLSEAAELLRTIDPITLDTAPVRFLADHIQKELDRERRRRSTDKQGKRESGVIMLGTK